MGPGVSTKLGPVALLGVSKEELAKLLANASDLPAGEAADKVDAAVCKILKRLRRGQTASFPGIGKFTPGAPPAFVFSQKPKRKGGRRGRK